MKKNQVQCLAFGTEYKITYHFCHPEEMGRIQMHCTVVTSLYIDIWILPLMHLYHPEEDG